MSPNPLGPAGQRAAKKVPLGTSLVRWFCGRLVETSAYQELRQPHPLASTVADRLREELNIFLSDFVSTHEIEGIKVELGNCSYDEAMAQYQLKIKVDGVETREQKALKMYAKLDGIDHIAATMGII